MIWQWPFARERTLPAAEEPAPPLPPTPAAIDPASFQMVANTPLFNPGEDEHVKAAMWRALHIADAIEQRKERGDPPHPEHDQLVAEAMAHGWGAVRAGKWTIADLKNLQARLIGA